MTQSNGGPGRDGTGGGGAEGRGDGGARNDSGAPGSRRLRRIAASSDSRAGRAYQGAIEAVFSIVIATGIGYWADTRYGTSPRWLIVGAIVGFGAFVLRLARMAKLVEDPMAGGDAAEPPRTDQPGEDPDDAGHRG
jgi:F0F1-type ATP synthase assembly protein I